MAIAEDSAPGEPSPGLRVMTKERAFVDGVELVPAEARLATILRERPGVPISAEELIARLWPDVGAYPPQHARQHVRELVYRVREAFRHQRGERVIATILGEGYVWRP